MKNNKWYRMIWMSVAVMALVLASCAKDTSSTKDKADVSEGYGLLSLGVILDDGKADSRYTEAEAETDIGTLEENYVGAVRLVLYGYDDHLVRYAFNFKIRTRTADDTGIPEATSDGREWIGFVEEGVAADEEPHLYWSDNEKHFITYARKVALDDYLMLLLLNPTRNDNDPARDLYAITAEGKPLSDFETAVSYAPTSWGGTFEQIRNAEQGGVAVDYKFLMNNHRGLIYVPESKLHSSVVASNNNPVRVPVSRVVAKVHVTETMPRTPNANVSNFKWELDVTNKKTYWTRKLTNLLTSSGDKGVMEEYGPVPVIDEDASWSSPQAYLKRAFLYAEDPNFAGLSSVGAPDPLDGTTGVAREQKLRALRWAEFNSQEYPGINAWDETHVTTPTLSQDLGDTTYCLENTMDVSDQYDGTVTSVLVSCNYWPAGYDDQEGYFIYNSYYVSPSDMRDYAGGTPIPYAELYGLYEDIQALEAATELDLTQQLSQPLESNNIKYYHQGLNFYSVKIVHYKSNAFGYGHYGVLRNNFYCVTLSSIKGPGSPTVTAPEPNNLVARINIYPWWDRTQLTEL